MGKEYKIPFVDTPNDKFVNGNDSILTLHENYLEWHWDNTATVTDRETLIPKEERHYGKIRVKKSDIGGMELVWMPINKCYNIGIYVPYSPINIYVKKDDCEMIFNKIWDWFNSEKTEK